jgi:hypothetical protein
MIAIFSSDFRPAVARARWCALLILAATCGCSTAPDVRELVSMPALSGVHRREQTQRKRAAKNTPATSQPAEVAVSRPAGVVASHPAGQTLVAGMTVKQAVRFDTNTIVQRVFDNSPTMRASREEMTAAEHALEEFKTNLSRFEPYVNSEASLADYPERRDAEGHAGEVVAGIEKETFEGAILKLEGGASGSEFHYGEKEKGQPDADRGSGSLMRARVEVPFIGSRKRQERVISQAFQDSQARKARLEYLSDFRTYVTSAMEYYLLAMLNKGYAETSEHQAQVIQMLLNDVRVKAADQARLTSTMESCRVIRDQYRTSQRTYSFLLLALLGFPMDTPFELVERPVSASRYLERLSTPEGRAAMTQEAYDNNPRFRVLQDAIKDAEVQRQQAIMGRYDVTAYMEGTQFPFGADTYDDRVNGWFIGGGLNVRLNDQRVLTASRKKAEAQIRQYQAEIEAERLTIQRRIVDNSEQLQAYYRIRTEAQEVARKKRAEFERRSAIYFEGHDPTVAIDDVLGPLSDWIVAENRVVANWYYIGEAELQIMTATGEVYRMVGMDINGGGNETTEGTTVP